MTGTIYLCLSMYLPSSRRLIFGVDKNTGDVRVVRNHVTFLPPNRYYRLAFDKREGAAQRDGVIRITSKEGVPVTMTYRLRFGISTDRLADARGLVVNGWSSWIAARVAEAVAAVTKQVPIEELLSPTSQFTTRRDVLRRVVAAHLAQSGLNVTAFEISRMDPDRAELLSYKRAELRRSARGVAGRVAIFGIDGADWELLQELAADDRIPNLKALVRGGATGNLQTVQPTVSPLVWTTLATGVTPDRHGVIDFFDPSSHAPVDSLTRRTPALWDIAEGFGRHATVVNWWTAWPPAPTPTAVFDTPVELLPNAIYPADLAQRVKPLKVDVSTVGYDQIRRFMNISPDEYQNAVSSNDAAYPVNVFRNVLAKTWSDHRVAIDMYRQQSPLLFMMTYDGPDTINHLFAPYHPPYRDGVSQDGYRRYWPTVANYYSEIDRLIGDWMNVLTDDTTVIIVSGYGFRWGKNRPMTPPNGSALADHRNPGIFIAFGNHVVPSRTGRPVSIYDIVPTTLAILGLPQSGDMQGAVAGWALKDVAPVQSVRVISYNEFFADRTVPQPARVNAQFYQRELQAVGHLLDPTKMQAQFDAQDRAAQTAANNQQPLPPQQWGTYAYYNNLGIQLRKQNKLKDAADAFQQAINLNPNRPTPYLNLAMVLFDRIQYTAADEAFLEAVRHGLPNGDQWFCNFAALYRTQNMTSRAINLLLKGEEIYPQSYAIAVNLGSALAQADRYTEGLTELERALGLQPSSTLALNNLGIFYAKKNDYARALDFWNRSLAIDARQPQVRAAAEAARSHL